MDLVRIEGDEEIVPHSADDGHQRYAQGDLEQARSTYRRVEVLIGDERRRRWSVSVASSPPMTVVGSA